MKTWRGSSWAGIIFCMLKTISSIKITSEKKKIHKSKIFPSRLECFFPQYYGRLITFPLSLSSFLFKHYAKKKCVKVTKIIIRMKQANNIGFGKQFFLQGFT